jgi:hypothetical protein
MANNRKNSRRNRKNRRNTMRRNRRNNINMMGGAELSMPAPVNDASMKGPMDMSLAQGQQYGDLHKNQHGGSYGPYPGAVTDEALISPSMALSARTAPLNAALNEIRGMSDQAGGRRRRRNTMRKNRKNRKNTRKNNMRKNRKNRRNNMTMRRRRNNMMGGAILNPMPASVSAPGLLLPAGLEAKAVSGMNAEWKLAENPRAFAPGL